MSNPTAANGLHKVNIKNGANVAPRIARATAELRTAAEIMTATNQAVAFLSRLNQTRVDHGTNSGVLDSRQETTTNGKIIMNARNVVSQAGPGRSRRWGGAGSASAGSGFCTNFFSNFCGSAAASAISSFSISCQEFPEDWSLRATVCHNLATPALRSREMSTMYPTMSISNTHSPKLPSGHSAISPLPSEEPTTTFQKQAVG